MKKLYIFDLDGTLLNTLDDLTNSVNFALKKYFLQPKTKKETEKNIGNGVRVLIDVSVPSMLPPERKKEIFSVFQKYYAQHYNDTTKPYEGILSVVKTLKKEGAYLAVVSNKPDNLTQKLIKEHFGNAFDVICGLTDGMKKKPYPDTVEYVLRVLRIEKEDAVYIGDSEVDIETAQNAGLPFVGVSWGYRGKNSLLSCGASAIVENPQEILNF